MGVLSSSIGHIHISLSPLLYPHLFPLSIYIYIYIYILKILPRLASSYLDNPSAVSATTTLDIWTFFWSPLWMKIKTSDNINTPRPLHVDNLLP